MKPEKWEFNVRYYLVGQDEEYVVDLYRVIRHSSELIEFHFSGKSQKDDQFDNKQVLFLRKLAGQYFCSKDKTRWEKIARQDIPTSILNTNRVLELFRGYRPSGSSASSQGGLLTQMPGKVVKILVKPGEEVAKGQTLLVLEAMKMENEIKSGIDGVIKNILVKEGDALEQGVLMIEVDKKS